MSCLLVACADNFPALSEDESSDSEPQMATMRSTRRSPSLEDDATSVQSDDEEEPVTANGGNSGDNDDDEDAEDSEDLEEDVYALATLL